MKNLKYLANGELILALAGWAVGLGGIITGRQAILQYLYFFAWYPYILFLDGLLGRLRGQSWLLDRPRQFVQMFFWSITIWLIFEALNLVLHNWGYVAVIPIGWVRWGGYVLAFTTVLPGVLLTAQVLEALGAFQTMSQSNDGAGVSLVQRRLKPAATRNNHLNTNGYRDIKSRILNLGAWQPPSLLVGVAFLVLPLVFPRYAFPLVWGAMFFLLDPFCDMLGGDSLIVRFAAGERRKHLCLLAAGLICGLWWETWNWFAITKWVYTLPVFNFGKVFEMPLLGYLGFPPFALECAVMYNFLKVLDDQVLTTPRRRLEAVAVQVFFWIIMFLAMDAWTVISYQ